MSPERSGAQGEGRAGRRNEEVTPPAQEGYDHGTVEDRGESVGDPDVLLNVPVLNVDKLDLEVEDLRARISFQAELADMVKINVGIDAEVGKAKIEIEGIEAQAQLKARLDNVRAIFSEVLNALQRDPELAQNMLRASDVTDEAGGVIGRDATRTGEAAARTGGTAAEEAGMAADAESAGTGSADQDIAEGSGSGGGSDGFVGEEEPGNLAGFPIEEEYLDDRGRVVGRAWDESGNVVEEIMDAEGNALEPDASTETVSAEAEEAANGVQATDAARRRASELGLKLFDVKGTGSGGRILIRDVENTGRNGG